MSDKSLGYRAVEALMRVYGTRRITDRSYEGLLRYAARRDAFLSGRPPRLLYAKYAVESFSVAGCPGYRIGPKSRRAEKAVLFLHGGAFVLQITPFHYRWIAHMIDALGVCVYVPLYPLAPRERCDRALDNLLCFTDVCSKAMRAPTSRLPAIPRAARSAFRLRCSRATARSRFRRASCCCRPAVRFVRRRSSLP